MYKSCRICFEAFIPVECQVPGDQSCCDTCRVILKGIAENGASRKLQPPEHEEMILMYQDRATRGVPLFS
jgi:hypothetical protein